jgi:hypothetical protein
LDFLINFREAAARCQALITALESSSECFGCDLFYNDIFFVFLLKKTGFFFQLADPNIVLEALSCLQSLVTTSVIMNYLFSSLLSIAFDSRSF